MDIHSESTLSSCRKNVFAFIALFILILVIYSNTFDATWHFDDENNILNNKPLHLTELTISNITKTFFADWNGSGRLYRPVACFSFALNYYFGGTDVTGYHIVNIAIHFLSAFFLFLFIYNSLKLPVLKEIYENSRYFVALLSATLWAVNPVQAQAVTYVVQRMASMSALFYIAAMYFYLRGRTSGPRLPRLTYYILCIGSGMLAIGSKENAVMLPMTIFLYDLILIKSPSKKDIKRYALLLLILLITAISVAFLIKGPSLFDPASLISGYQNRGFTLPERLLTEPRIILFYISLLLYPMPNRLCLEHDITISTGFLTPPSTLLAIIFILAILAASVAWAKKRPFIAFCVIFFFLNHLIEASVFPLELIFEHRNYLPSMLFFVPFATLLSNGIQLFSNRRVLQGALVGFIVLVLIGWGHSTYLRNRIWQTPGTLALDCVEKCPNLARAHHNLGRLYAQNNLYKEAIAEFLLALTKEDMNNLAGRNWTYYNLGSMYQALENDDKALSYYNEAQKYQPHFAPTHIRKGQIFLKRGRYDRAADEFQKASENKEHRSLALTNLGHLFLKTGHVHSAIEQFELAIATSPRDPEIMRRLGLAHRLANQTEKAFRLFKASIDIDPNAPFTLLNLAAIYQDKGMAVKKSAALDQFFAIFGSSTTNLKRFIAGMRTESDPKSAIDFHQQYILRFLAAALQEKSREYAQMAEDCLGVSQKPN